VVNGPALGDVRLSDGRRLAFIDYGDPLGHPVIFIHGFGESALFRHWDDHVAAKWGLRMIAPHLPGIGGSSRSAGRTLTQWARDCEEFANTLGLDRFLLAGHSAGGPHALATAARLQGRVSRLVLVSPTGPIEGRSDIAMFRSRELRIMVRLCRAGLGGIVRALLAESGWATRLNAGLALKIEASMYRADRTALLEPAEQRALNETALLQGMGQAPGGTYDTLAAVVAPWGFDLSDVRQPTHVFLGEADNLVSPGMIERLVARLPDARLNRWPDLGHFGFLRAGPWGEVMQALAKGAAPIPR